MSSRFDAQFLHGLQDFREERQERLREEITRLVADGVKRGFTDAELEQAALKLASARMGADIRFFASIGAAGVLP